MYVIGELRDKDMAEDIVRELNERNIPVQITYNPTHDVYILLKESEENLSLAQDHFRVRMGFKRPLEIEPEWIKIKRIPRGDYTYGIMALCVALYLFSYSEMGVHLYNLFFFGNVESPPFQEILRGQVWRLLTPIFLHMGLLHILFNLLMFKDFGNLIEYSFGKHFFILFVIGTGIVSNFGQYLIGGPSFGGISGVLYAMLGFIWVYKAVHVDFEFALPKRDIGVMIFWYFLCLADVFMDFKIANMAHGAGLVSGMILAATMNWKRESVRIKYIGLAVFFLVFTLLVEYYKLKGRFFITLWAS